MSRTSLPLLLALALAAPTTAGVLLLPAPALAQPGALAEPLVQVLPADQLVGDGRTATTLHILALGVDGRPLSGLTGRISASQGTAGRIEGGEGGIYRFSYTAPEVSAPTEVEFTLRVKATSTANMVQKSRIQVVPAVAHNLSISSNPPQVVLGQDASATVTITLTGGPEASRGAADLAVKASSGTLANVTPLGGGRYSMLYTAPDKKFPHLALLTLADRRNPDRIYAAMALPMSGRTPFPVTGLPDSNVLVRVAGVEFGPVTADSQGRATVNLTVPPGVNEATVVSIKGDQKEEKPIDLKVPATQRVQMLPTAAMLPADGSTRTTLRAFVAQPDGRPDPNARVSFKVDSGTVGAARHENAGIYAAEWTPAAQSKPGTAKVEVQVEDARGPQVDSVELKLLASLPGSLELKQVGAVGPDGRFQVAAEAQGGPAVRGIELGAAGATAVDGPSSTTPGQISATYKLNGPGATILAVARAEASGNPLHRVLVLPASAHLTSDGQSSIPVAVLTVDAAGYPVANVPVALSVAQGDATIPASLTTNAYGVGIVELKAGTGRGLLVVQANSSGIVGAAGVVQAPAGVDPGVLPPTGDALAQSLRARWAPLVRSLSVRGGSAVALAPVPAATAPATDGGSRNLSAAVASLEVSSSAPSVAAGQTVTLTITARDRSGHGLAGRQIQVFTNAGTAGAATDQGDGRYTVQLTAPTGGADVMRVTALSPESGLSRMIELPVSAPPAEPVWGLDPGARPPEAAGSSASTAPPATAETGAATPKPPRASRPAGARDATEHPWLRAQAGFLGGMYAYRQVPFTATGPLYGRRVAFGGGESAAAGNAGLGADVQLWTPGFDYLGARAGFRTTRYSVQLAEFDAVIPDWLNELELLALARVPVDVGALRVSPALRVGGAVNDFMVYRQDTSGDSPVLDYGPLIAGAFLVGAEVGIDQDSTFAATVGATIGLNGGGRSTYSRGVDLDLAWTFMDPLYVYGQVQWIARGTGVYAATDGANQLVGDLDDSLTAFGLGAGLQF